MRGSGVDLYLLSRRRTSDHRRDDSMCKQPRNRQLQDRVPAQLRELDEYFHVVEVLVGQKAPVALVLRDPRPLGNRSALPILSSQQTAHERKKGKERDALPLTLIEHALLRFSMKKAVLILNAHESR